MTTRPLDTALVGNAAYLALVERIEQAASQWDQVAKEADSPEGRRSAERRASSLRMLATPPKEPTR